MRRIGFWLVEFLARCLRPAGQVLAIAFTFAPLSANAVGLANLRSRLGLTPWAARVVMAKVHLQYVCYFYELAVLWPLGLIRTDGRAAFGDLAASIKARYGLGEDRGIICLGAHYANIEAMGDVMRTEFQRIGHKDFYVLAKPSRYAWANAILNMVREKRGFQVLWTGGPDFAASFDALLRSGRQVALVSDQKPRKGGMFVPFFGQEAAFPDKGVLKAIDLGLGFIHMTLRRTSPGRFVVLCEEGNNAHLQGHSAETPDSAAFGVISAYVHWLEGLIREEPGQWSWDYRKWSRKKA